jgi:hypothetical protein
MGLGRNKRGRRFPHAGNKVSRGGYTDSATLMSDRLREAKMRAVERLRMARKISASVGHASGKPQAKAISSED